VAPAAWEGVADYVTAAAACPQPLPSPITPLQLNKTSEDCLYLNIYTPEDLVRSVLFLFLTLFHC
jgi:carboxylesterase type B